MTQGRVLEDEVTARAEESDEHPEQSEKISAGAQH